VQLQDTNNQPLALSGVVVSVHLASGSGLLTGRVSSTRATTDANGVASFVGVTILGEGNHTLRFSAQDMVPILSAPFPVAAPTVTALENAVPVAGLTDGAGSSVFYSITVPQGQTQLQVTTSGGFGDVDLFMQLGRTPDIGRSGFDCASVHRGNAEVCTVALPEAGVWYIMLLGGGYSGVTLVARYDAATQLAITTQPGGAVSGKPLTIQPVVAVQDANGQPAARANVAVRAAIAAGSGVVHRAGHQRDRRAPAAV
jgi:hypothetical protein